MRNCSDGRNRFFLSEAGSVERPQKRGPTDSGALQSLPLATELLDGTVRIRGHQRSKSGKLLGGDASWHPAGVFAGLETPSFAVTAQQPRHARFADLKPLRDLGVGSFASQIRLYHSLPQVCRDRLRHEPC